MFTVVWALACYKHTGTLSQKLMCTKPLTLTFMLSLDHFFLLITPISLLPFDFCNLEPRVGASLMPLK